MTNLTPNNIALGIYATIKDKKGSELKEALGKVVSYLAKKRLLNKTEAILDAFKKIINKKEKIVEAKVISAKALTNHDKHELKHELIKKYRANELVLHEEVDKDVLGGVRIQVEDELIDLTLKNKIEKLQEHLIKSA